MAIATAAFLAAWLPSGRDGCTVVRIELTDPSALTLYLSSREISTPNVTSDTVGAAKQFWQGALSDIGAVAEPGDLGAYDPGLATFDFTLSGRPLAGQAVDDFSLEKLASHYWYGATVTAWYWEVGLNSFLTDALQIFKGVVIEYETESNKARIYCQQRNNWVKRLPIDEVKREKYPRSPEKSVGLPIPICYGSLLTAPARSPATAQGAFNQTMTGLRGVTRAGVRGAVVSIGKGDAGTGLVLFAGHACKTFNSDADGSTPAIPIGDRLCEVDPAAGATVNAATGTGFSFDDITSADVQPFDVFYPLFPADSKQSASNQGDNARAATDTFNDTSYARLDYDAGEREIIIPLPDAAPQGLYISSRSVVTWSTSAGATALRADFVNAGVGGGHTATLAATADLNTKTGAGASIGSGKPATGWNFGGESCYIRVYFTGVATGQKARIYGVGVTIKFRPNWPVVTPASSYLAFYIRTAESRHRGSGSLFDSDWNRPWFSVPLKRAVAIPATTRVDSEFYATLEGYADDGSGTYTGTAAALIQRPPDILRHLLATYCGETLFETGGNPGDLTTLRSSLTTWRAGDMKAAFAIDEFVSSSDVLRILGQSTATWFFISCFTDKWCGVPWKAGRAVDFPRRLNRYDLMEPAGPKIIMHRDAVQNDIQIGYGRDAWTGKMVHDTRLSSARSNSGHDYRRLRDESMTVVASESDRLDFSDGTSRTVNLTPGAYAPMGLAAHVAALVRAVTTNAACQVAWGFQIVAGVNDKLTYDTSGVDVEVTLTAGAYTGTTMATEVARALNASSTNWTCTYSASTNKFTIDRTAGTKVLRFGLHDLADGCACTLGFLLSDVTCPQTSVFAVEPERFAIILKTSTLSLLWETGTNGIDAATPRACGALLGFDMARDYAEGATYALAHSPKAAREIECATSVARYGSRPTLTVELDYVNDTDTAREVRNRLQDLWGQPPVEIQFSTERMPDLQKGMVFDFDSSLDDVKPYAVPGSDGSWLGKEFVAVRVVRHSLPTPHQSVVAFEVPAS